MPSLRGSKILNYGGAHKRDVRDVRESPTLEIIHETRSS
jgi:UDP-N-acetyl-D-mannosaminuronate dehydrogenase